MYLILENSTFNGELLLYAQEKQPTIIMPRGARLDSPGTLHHVMAREIDGNRIGMDVVLEALKRYQQRKHKDLPALMHYAAVCRVASVMKPYLEATL